MIPRLIQDEMLKLTRYFPIVSVNGPRQSGKTTLIREVFPDMAYASLENPDDRLLATEDPHSFLSNYPKGAIFDEVQRVPELFSYIQGIVDSDREAKFILSGSQNFLLSEQISQSLAGRVGILTLLPFSFDELKEVIKEPQTFEELLFKGFYPRLYDKEIPPTIYYPNYMSTYVERDVRLIKNIGDLKQFTLFMKLCAGRTGQLINYSNLANDTGVSVNTVRSWISVLEASYIVFTLPPYYKNFNKRLIRSSKLYFYDTGLLCYLLDIDSPQQLTTHYNKGGIFENYVILEVKKYFQNKGVVPHLFFWQDNKGLEIDLIIEKAQQTTAVEVKSGKTYSSGFMDNLKYWQKLSGADTQNSFIIYGGAEGRKIRDGRLIAWNEITKMLK